MSLSRVIRGAEAERSSRWEFPAVDGSPEAEAAASEAAAAEAPPEDVEEPPRFPTASELEAIREQARAEGHEEGREAGYRDGEAAAQKAAEKEAKRAQQEQKKRLQTLTRLIDAQAEPLEQLDDDVQEQLAQLALTLARQVIRRELRTQPGEILGVIREAVALLPMGARDVRVHVHPDDHRFLRELLGDDAGERAWRLVDDPALTRGGCRVEAERSRIDATLERRLAQLASQLLGGREEDRHAEAERSVRQDAEDDAARDETTDSGGDEPSAAGSVPDDADPGPSPHAPEGEAESPDAGGVEPEQPEGAPDGAADDESERP